ncbi:MAG: ANTAR domain-containing protein [Oscillospiraceae bacterium]|nr:ANTAR domain-containing protein [Oscillospiraceae bacterium]
MFEVTTVDAVSQGRLFLRENTWDIVIINSPVGEDSGVKLAKEAAKIAQVILVVKNDSFGDVATKCDSDGILTISKPVNVPVFDSAVRLARTAQQRVRRVQEENAQLVKKIEDMRVIDRAKLLLVSSMKMSENEAHRYIEKHAMDMRSTRRAVADGILRTYEN